MACGWSVPGLKIPIDCGKFHKTSDITLLLSTGRSGSQHVSEFLNLSRILYVDK